MPLRRCNPLIGGATMSATPDNNPDAPIVLASQYDEYERLCATATLTPSTDTRRCVVQAKGRIVPVLFVPGIMGSNLNYVDTKGNTKTAWGPPNGFLDGIGQSLTYRWFHSPADRAEALDPDNTSVKNDGRVHPVPNTMPTQEDYERAPHPSDDQEREPPEVLAGRRKAIKRGWGSVHFDSYADFLLALQEWLDRIHFKPEEHPWSALLQDSSAAPDSQTTQQPPEGFAGLTAAELLHASNFRFPVYACGYNWLQSNRRSALGYKSGPDVGVNALADRIENILTELRAHHGNGVGDQVIIVTHSMGGLVARAYAKAHPCRVLGIVHGVMPATGAPATYKRARAGFGREGEGVGGTIKSAAAANILGKDAEHAAPPLLNSEGALQLLPWPDYGLGTSGMAQEHEGAPLSHWVRVRRKGEKTVLLALSRDEVLSSSAWYALLPDGDAWKKIDDTGSDEWKTADAKWGYTGKESGVERDRRITPSDERAMEIRKRRGITEKPEDDRVALKSRIARVTEFQKGHANVYLTDRTYAFYANDPKQKSWWTIDWEGDIPADVTPDMLRNAKLDSDDGQGRLRVKLQDGSILSLDITPPTQPGDGTVPACSGQAPAQADVPTFTHTGYEHSECYQPEFEAVVHNTLYGIVKFVQSQEAC
ncbi:lipase family alpha/beta hydrolase [Uliginosibacterium sp. sgz301328]|uniref:lipase family alpha/beta hydrolase n=1 Tax=Uliginosibacterium sp. sgz301328 TaxID=3243764 RepID=UPI00359EEA56